MTCMMKNWKDRQHLPTDYCCGEHEHSVSLFLRFQAEYQSKDVYFDDLAVPDDHG